MPGTWSRLTTAGATLPVPGPAAALGRGKPETHRPPSAGPRGIHQVHLRHRPRRHDGLSPELRRPEWHLHRPNRRQRRTRWWWHLQRQWGHARTRRHERHERQRQRRRRAQHAEQHRSLTASRSAKARPWRAFARGPLKRWRAHDGSRASRQRHGSAAADALGAPGVRPRAPRAGPRGADRCSGVPVWGRACHPQRSQHSPETLGSASFPSAAGNVVLTGIACPGGRARIR